MLLIKALSPSSSPLPRLIQWLQRGRTFSAAITKLSNPYRWTWEPKITPPLPPRFEPGLETRIEKVKSFLADIWWKEEGKKDSLWAEKIGEREREEGGTQSSNQLVHFLIPATRWNSIKLAKLEGKTGNSVGRFPPVPLSSSSVGSSLRVK